MNVTNQTNGEVLISKNSKLSKRELIVLLVILLLGLFFRLYDLAEESLWLDEGYSIKIATLNVVQIWENASWDNHPPLYYIILHFWIKFWGSSEFSTRFLSLIFGFLSIIMIYKVGKLLFNKETGVISALLLAISPFHIRYSQEVRMYSLMALLTLFSFYYFINLLKERNRMVLIGYTLSSSLLLYAHIYGLFIVLAQNIYVVTLLFFSKNDNIINIKNWAFLQSILIILYAPYIEILFIRMVAIQGGFWIPEPHLSTILVTFLYYYSIYFNTSLYFLLILSFFFSFFSIVTIEKIKGKMEWNDFFESIESYRWNIGLVNVKIIYLLFIWLLTPLMIPFIISKIMTPIFFSKYTIGASLAFLLMIARGINNIKFKATTRIRNINFNYKHLKLVIIGLIITISLAHDYTYYATVEKENWRNAAYIIDTNAEAGDLILFNAGYIQDVFNYYSKRTDLVKKAFPSYTNDVNEENIKELEPMVKGFNRVWIILAYSGDSKGLIIQTMRQFYNIEYRGVLGIKIYFCTIQG